MPANISDTTHALQAFENAWIEQRPELDPGAVSLDLRLQLAAKHFMANSNRALSEFDLEWWEYDVLSALRRAGAPYECAVHQLSDIVPLSSGALSNRLNQLVARALITRRHDTTDRRRVLVRLSNTGLKRVDKAATARFEAAESVAGALNPNEQKRLNALLDKLLDARASD